MTATPRFGFPRAARLLAKADFDRVFQTGKRISGTYFAAVVADSALQAPRIGLALAKKQTRHAFARNRLKRLIREYFRLHRTDLPAVDVIFIARSAAQHQGNFDLVADLAKLTARLS